MNKDYIKKAIYYSLVLIFLIFTTIILFHNLLISPPELDIDELFTLNLLYTNNLYEVIKFGNILDNHPPLYNLIMFFFTKCFGLSEHLIRIPSVIFSIISFYLVFVLGKKIHSPVYGLTSLIITIVLIPKPWIAFYARGYALLLLFSILTMINLINIINFKVQNPNKTMPFKIIFYFIISSLMCVYTHYFGCILVFCELLFLFIIFHKQIIKEIIIIVTSLILLFGPWLLISHPKKVFTINPVFTDWLNWNVFSNYNVYFLLFIIITGILYYIYNIKTYRKEPNYAFLFIVYLFIFPFSLVYLIDKFVINCYQHKYLIISLIPFYILIANTFVIFFKSKINLILVLLIFYLVSEQRYVNVCKNTGYPLSFIINNHNKYNKPIIIIDNYNMFNNYYKYHFDKYCIKENIVFLNNFDTTQILETVDNIIKKNDGKCVWLFDATSIYDIKTISDNREIIVFNKELPSIYLIKDVSNI